MMHGSLCAVQYSQLQIEIFAAHFMDKAKAPPINYDTGDKSKDTYLYEQNPYSRNVDEAPS